MQDEKTKALKVLCYDRATRKHLEKHDPMALLQALNALGETKTLADWLLAFDARILNAITEHMEEDHDEDVILEFRGLEIESELGQRAADLVTAAKNLMDCGMGTPEALDQVWAAVVTEICFWNSEAGMREMTASLI